MKISATVALLVEVLTGGTWEEMAKFCDGMSQGSLLCLDSLTVYSSIIEYLTANGLSEYSFWTDGNDRVLEGHFFHNNGYAVYMGTPYWAYTCNSQQECQQEPLGGVQENCVEMDGGRFHYLNDVSCNEFKHVICQR
ncbi:uncharacterized protein [Macrobrachium rosenbergii]|uniref:uncharacterized protein n=1 Tax=Macrobrachium rosenbergii TaxID=79674 RepID=UPI0034D77EA0